MTLFYELIAHYHPNIKGNWRDSLFNYTATYKSAYGENLSNLAKAEMMFQEGNFRTGTDIFTANIDDLEKKGFYAQAALGLLRLGAGREMINQNRKKESEYPIYYKKALELANKAKQPTYQVLVLGYMADWQLEKQNFIETIKISNQMLKIVSQDKTYSAFQFLGAAYKYLGFGYLGLDNIAKAEKYFTLARLWTRSPARSLYLDYTILQSLGEYYFKKKQYHNTLKQCDRAISTLIYWKSNAKLIDADKYIGNIYDLKYKTFKKLKNLDSALVYHEKLYTQIDINIHGELEKNYAEFQERYKTKEKELQISELNNKVLENKTNIRNLIIYFLIATLIFSAVLLGLIFRSLKLKEKNTQFAFELANTKNELAAKVIQTQETERQRIAKDLHDDLGGTLSVIKGKIAYEKVSQETINLVEQAIDDLRYISRNLAPPELENDGLIQALHTTIDRVQNVSNIKFTFITFGEKQRLNPDIKINVYRIITELINNILKHSKAQNAIIQLIYYQESLQILVEDDGVGIKSDKNNWGIGLKNINSRVQFLGAELDIDSSAKGTTVIIELPIKSKK
ncbi:sensor histidine kinase [Emticicia sp. SJ17W-69]|uniref:sensor histidine kinase n=1 Tax=Emticicia sp. SJ17W-69 TaxID=3421657 RepID=UPI003EBC3543